MESYEGGLRISFHFHISDRVYDGSVRKQRDRERLSERKRVPAAGRLRDRADPELCGIDHADAALYGRSPELPVAGLCSSAGLGLLVLFRMNRSMKENVTVLAFLVVIAVTAGSILQAVGLP